MIIKKIEMADSVSISEIEKSCFSDLSWSLEQIQSHLKNNSGIAIYSVKIIGYLLFLENPYEIEILRLGVSPKERNKGYSTILISELCKTGKEIFLEVSSLNLTALQLYKKCGFEMISERKKYYTDGSDALVLKKNPRQSANPIF